MVVQYKPIIILNIVEFKIKFEPEISYLVNKKLTQGHLTKS